MAADHEEVLKISLLLSRHLSLEGYNSQNTTYCKNATVAHDMVKTVLTYADGCEQYYTAGSKAEGTETAESDQDAMVSCRGLQVLNKDENVIADDKITFVKETDKIHTDYVRLTPSVFNKTLDHPYLKINFSKLLVQNDQNRYLSSESFRMLMLNVQDVLPFSKTQHGPCVMLDIDSLYRDTYINKQLNAEHDFAYAIPCLEWPEEAKEWKNRKRTHGWPSASMMQKITKMVCHVVAVGNADSNTSSIEWRQSFLLSERYLVWNFNDTQIHSYVIMKQLVKNHLEPIAPNQISSYNIKTLIFWMIEEKGLEKWKPTNLLECVSSCLDRLAKSVEEKSLSHYFMRKQNLFHSKFLTVQQCQGVIDTIRTIQCEIIDFTLNIGLFRDSKLGRLYAACEGNLKLFASEANSIFELGSGYQKTLSNYQAIRKSRAIFSVLKRLAMQFATTINPEDAQRSPEVLANLFECEEQTLNQISAFVEIRKGLTALHQMYEIENVREDDDLGQRALKCFKTGTKLDLMSGPLYLASYYFQQGDIQNCLNTIEMMMKSLPRRMIFTGFSSADQYIGYENGKFIPVKKLEDHEANEQTPVVYDMLFVKDDYKIVPQYLVLSCALLPDFGDKYLTIHPCVYTLFLRLSAIYSLKGSSHPSTKRAFEELKIYINESTIKPHFFHSYNLLALCCHMLRKSREMLEYFSMSLGMTSRMPNVQNAAIWWLLVIVSKVCQTL